MKRCLGVMALLGVTACSSVAWVEPPSTTTWRGARLFHGPRASVVAADEDQAVEVYHLFADVDAAVVASGFDEPRPPLLIAVETGRVDLLGDENQTKAALEEWSPQARQGIHGRDGDEVPFALWLPTVAIKAPADSPRLALPAEWREGHDEVVLVASDTCVDEVVDALYDLGLEHEKIGTFQRLLLLPFKSMLQGMMVDELRKRHKSTMLSLLVPHPESRPEAAAACLERLGIGGDAPLAAPAAVEQP